MSIADKLTTIAENQQKIYDAGARNKCRRVAEAFWLNIDEDTWDGSNLFRGAYSEYIEALAARDMYPDGVHVEDATDMFLGAQYKGSYYDSGLPLFREQSLWVANEMFEDSCFTVLPPLDLTYCASAGEDESRCRYIFAYSDVVIIDGLTWDDRRGCPLDATAFEWCDDLEEIRFYGQCYIDVPWNLQRSEKLTHDTLVNILKRLSYDIDGPTTLTIGSVNLAKLTDDELSIAWKKGWDVV